MSNEFLNYEFGELWIYISSPDFMPDKKKEGMWDSL